VQAETVVPVARTAREEGLLRFSDEFPAIFDHAANHSGLRSSLATLPHFVGHKRSSPIQKICPMGDDRVCQTSWADIAVCCPLWSRHAIRHAM
jgi:hypothetical protein